MFSPTLKIEIENGWIDVFVGLMYSLDWVVGRGRGRGRGFVRGDGFIRGKKGEGKGGEIYRMKPMNPVDF